MDEQETEFTTFQERAEAAKAEARQEYQDRLKALKQDFRRVAKTPEGVTVLAYVMNLCGFHNPDTTYDPRSGELNLNTTLYNAARRNVWLTLRNFVPAQQLALIELPPEQEEEPCPTTQQHIVPAP